MDFEATIQTSRLDLIPLRREHAEPMYPLLCDGALYEFTGGNPPVSLDVLAALYERRETRHSPDGKELWLNWMIRERESGEAVGYVQATIAASKTNVAWVVGTHRQGLGFATEAARAVVALLVVQGVSGIQACVHQRHLASQKVAAKAGFTRTLCLSDGEEVWVFQPGPSNDPSNETIVNES